jgi:hypothetical protein
MKFPTHSFKIATKLIEQKLAARFGGTPQVAEPADLPTTIPAGRSALRLLGKNEGATAKENPAKVVTDSAITSEAGREVE